MHHYNLQRIAIHQLLGWSKNNGHFEATTLSVQLDLRSVQFELKIVYIETALTLFNCTQLEVTSEIHGRDIEHITVLECTPKTVNIQGGYEHLKSDVGNDGSFRLTEQKRS